ncbi:MAG: GntR family transcriptional regulator [Phycisphaeraceae bacterium]|nr:GntR family transcriptional regulator [Phycisphaeraceae bacterium]
MAGDLSDVAYDRIREQLISGRLKAGDKISESTLAQQFNVSRTPVRQAIRRLQVEGLLYQVPRSGTYVSRPSRARLIETYEIRMAVEGFAALKAASVITREALRELGRQCDNMRRAARDFRESKQPLMSGEILERFLSNDLAFHVLILKTAENSRFTKLIMGSRIDTMMFGTHTHDRPLPHISRVWLLHHRVYMALRRRDGQMARHWMETHIRDSMRVALAQYDRAQIDQSPYRPLDDDMDKTVLTMLNNMVSARGSQQ